MDEATSVQAILSLVISAMGSAIVAMALFYVKRYSRLEAILMELHTWHNQKDDNDRFKWYVPRYTKETLQQAIEAQEKCRDLLDREDELRQKYEDELKAERDENKKLMRELNETIQGLLGKD